MDENELRRKMQAGELAANKMCIRDSFYTRRSRSGGRINSGLLTVSCMILQSLKHVFAKSLYSCFTPGFLVALKAF